MHQHMSMYGIPWKKLKAIVFAAIASELQAIGARTYGAIESVFGYQNEICLRKSDKNRLNSVHVTRN